MTFYLLHIKTYNKIIRSVPNTEIFGVALGLHLFNLIHSAGLLDLIGLHKLRDHVVKKLVARHKNSQHEIRLSLSVRIGLLPAVYSAVPIVIHVDYAH